MSDEFEKWTFDEEFVRGGRHEPAARTRAAIAKHGSERTSWRQPGAPVAEKPRRRRRSFSVKRSLGFTLLASAIVGLSAWTILSRDDSGPPTVPPIGNGYTAKVSSVPPDHGDRANADNQVSGIDEATDIGTCFRAGVAQQRASYQGDLDLQEVGCAVPHNFELVAIESASGGAGYPADTYWSGPVARSCAHALVRYAGPRAHGAPHVAGRMSAFFNPTHESWAQGDRTVYCLAHSIVRHTGSVRAR